jgi:hypothetical protein
MPDANPEKKSQEDIVPKTIEQLRNALQTVTGSEALEFVRREIDLRIKLIEEQDQTVGMIFPFRGGGSGVW